MVGSMEIFTPILIAGAGPAGVACAIQLKRSNVKFLLISENVGGLVRNANLIENLAGFSKGISGKDYAHLLKEHLKNLSIPVIFEKILKIESSNDKTRVFTEHQIYSCQFLVFALGTIPKMLNVPGESYCFQKGLLKYEVVNVIPILHKRDISSCCIIGSGDAAYDYALNLAKYISQVFILQRNEKSKALPLLQERVNKNPRISVITNVSIEKFCLIRQNEVQLFLNSLSDLTTINTSLVVVAIGREPNSSLLSSINAIDNQKDEEKSRILFIGDIKNANKRQISLALGNGISVAMELLTKFK
jgi:thioredoxin reductase (NADPH)